MTMQGVRAATTVDCDTEDNVLSATRELLKAVLAANPDLKPVDIGSVIFTVTEDIISAFPARAARQLGWEKVPMICTREIPVSGSLPLCIRVLIHWNTAKKQAEIRHVYLRAARTLRPDLNLSNNIGNNK
jgi:chorismate mutase